MRIISLIMPGPVGEVLGPDGEPFGSGEPVTGAAERSGAAQTDAVVKDGAFGCSGCQDLGYCRRGLGPEELGAGCGASGAMG